MQELSENLYTLKSLPAFNFSQKMRPKEYDLNEIVMELEKLLPQYLYDGIDVQILKTDKDLKVVADAKIIKEAFVNLIRNANEAMPSGGTLTMITQEMYFRDEAQKNESGNVLGRCALVSIIDTGSGMDASTRERIHEPFFTTKEGPGRGLGFSIVSRIIEQHHGNIKVESKPGVGTMVNVYLPLLSKSLFQVTPIPLSSDFSQSSNHRYGGIPSKNEIFL